jgi:colanic acid/amylovoran biosynthesis glycosyltransferase
MYSMLDLASGSELTPRLAVLTQQFGAGSEVWLWRQVMGFERLAPSVVCWDRLNEETFPVKGVPVYEIESGMPRRQGLRRRLIRLRNRLRRNFYATFGKERRQLLDVLGKMRPAVALAQFGYMGLRVLPVTQELKIPLVVHFHGIDLSKLLRERLYRRSLKAAVGSFSAMVVVNAIQRDRLIDMGADRNRITIIPCGADTGFFTGERRSDNQVVRVVAVGRFVEKKGWPFAIRAFARFYRNSPEARLDLVGDGPLREDLEALVDTLGIRDATTFHGFTRPEETRNRFREASIFVQCSVRASDGDEEGCPVSVTEAMASEIPVVVFDTPGMADQVIDGETGYLVEEGDTEALAERLTRLAGDAALRTRLGENAVKQAQQFDIKGQIRKLEDVLLQHVRREN